MIHLGESSVFKWRPRPFPRGDNYKNSKNTLTKLRKSSSQEPLRPYQPNLAWCILGWRDSSLSNEGPHPFPRGTVKNLKNLLKNHWTKFGTKHPWVKRIQVCSNEGHCPFPWGNNLQNSKYTPPFSKRR